MADLDDIKDGKDFRTDQPQQNIPFTLKGCGALDWGMQSRLSRIFNPKTGNTVMLAFDHGYFQGPTTGLERIDINIAPLFEHADVLMCTRGILRSVVPPATNKPVVLRASGANSILAELSNEAVALSMDDAVRLGNDSNLLIVFYVQIMPDDLVMQLHRFCHTRKTASADVI